MVFIVHQRCVRHLASQVHLQIERNSRLLLHTSCVRYNSSQQGDRKIAEKKQSSSDHSVSVFERLNKEDTKAVTVTQKVVENAKTSVNLFVIIGGCGIVLYLAYMVLSEFFSNVSPSSVFKMAMKKIMKDERTSLILGDKIKGYGDPNSRTRKRLEHQPYMVADVDYLRVIFHVEGTKRSGVVSCDLKKSKNGWKTRYIIIKLDGFPPGKITIEDNRHETDAEDLPDIDYSDVAFSEENE
ncbi:uncharacterized protein LOC134814322 [Bolinopsis microptera]|uniref:uncharacterized protein LOC134814322 n=1 Tax=Bolinopsis microptera TaxID=2820187 RepID=UPI003078D88D